nr:unnamed protein product [Callosobruchus analis]
MGPRVVILPLVIYWLSNSKGVDSLLNPYKPQEVKYHKDDVGKPLILTPLLEQNKTDEARKAANVSLGGDYKNDPVLLWLQGGPGWPSMFGLFMENGPIAVDKNSRLKIREHSWTNNHSVLYIDNPVGTGFSFTDNDDGYARNETQVGKELYIALQQFFTLFPELRKNDFFATGESYAGKYVPALAYTIHKNNPTASKKINLRGIAIGNGYIDPLYQKGYAEYLYQLGLVDSTSSRAIKESEDKAVRCISNGNYSEAAKAFDEVQEIMNNVTGNVNPYNYLQLANPQIEAAMIIYLNKSETRRAIHVGNVTFGSTKVHDNLHEDMPKSMTPWFIEVVNNYRVLLYSGQLDIIVAYPLTINLLHNIEFRDAGGYRNARRKIWYDEKEVAGYVKTYGHLTEVLVRNSGHMVPFDQPKWAVNMITSFTRNQTIGQLS